MKENRKIEELILMFATHATSVLKKEPTLAGDGWKLELNNQIAQFIKILRECFRGAGHVSHEILSRLDTYTAKLAPTLSSGNSQSDSGYDSGSTSRDRDSVSIPTISDKIADMHMVKTVADLFKIPEEAMQAEVDRIRRSVVSEKVSFYCLSFVLSLTCLEFKAAMTDLKVISLEQGTEINIYHGSGYRHAWRTLVREPLFPAVERISIATPLGNTGALRKQHNSNN